MAERSEPTSEEVRRMNHIELELDKFVKQFRENTEAAIVVGAMMRVARNLIELYPENISRELIVGSVAFLERRDLEARPESPIFQIPKGWKM